MTNTASLLATRVLPPMGPRTLKAFARARHPWRAGGKAGQRPWLQALRRQLRRLGQGGLWADLRTTWVARSRFLVPLRRRPGLALASRAGPSLGGQGPAVGGARRG